MVSVEQEDDDLFAATTGVEAMSLTGENTRDEHVNPHAFIDPNVGVTMAKNIRDALSAIDPDHETEYRNNAEDYVARLEALADENSRKIADIPDERRLVLTSHRAF